MATRDTIGRRCYLYNGPRATLDPPPRPTLAATVCSFYRYPYLPPHAEQQENNYY